MGSEKMAKSVGNIRGLAEVLDEVGRDTLLCSSARATTASRWRTRASGSTTPRGGSSGSATRAAAGGGRVAGGARRHRDAFFDALADDFNTPRALAAMADWIREANRADGPVGDSHLREMLAVLGLENLLEAGEGAPAEVVELAERRAGRARERDFAESDRLRDELRARGWEVRDGPRGKSSSRSARDARRPPPRFVRRRPRRPRVIVYGRNAVREAIRGPAAGADRLGDAGAAREFAGAAARPPRSRGAAAPTPTRASAPTSRSTATPTPPRCCAAADPCWSRSTRSPTRRTSARSAAPPSASARPA